jgi:hypothetical protein
MRNLRTNLLKGVARMTGNTGAPKYEFSEQENRLMSGLSRALSKFGIAVLVAGLLFVAYLLVSFIDPFPILNVGTVRGIVLSAIDYALWILIALLVIYLSITIMKLAVPIRLIAETQGADVGHLMSFIADLTRICKLFTVSLIVICIIIVISLVLMILVF